MLDRYRSDLYREHGVLKKHSNVKIATGENGYHFAHFETLLDNKRINLYNRTRIMDVCRDWWKLNNSEITLEEFL